MALARSTLQRATDALAAYLQTALGSGVTIFGNWPEADKRLPPKAVSIQSVGPRRVELGLTQMQKVVASTATTPPDPANVQRVFTWTLASFRQDVQLDVWATSFAACDDIVARLDDALMSGPGVTLGLPNQDPFRDGCLVNLDPATGAPGIAEFFFDGQDDDQTPQQAGHDEWRATFRGECAVNHTRVLVQPRLKGLELRLKTTETTDPGETDVYKLNPDGTYTHTVETP